MTSSAREFAIQIALKCAELQWAPTCLDFPKPIVELIEARDAELQREARLAEAEWWWATWCPLPHGTGAREEVSMNRFSLLRAAAAAPASDVQGKPEERR